MASRSRSFSRKALLAALGACVGPAGGCGAEDPGDSIARLWADEGRWRVMATPVDDAVLIDFDFDGEVEAVALSREGRKLSLARGSEHTDGWRSLVFFDGEPVGLAALPGEVAVALSEPPRLAIFGVDPEGRLERRRDIALSGNPAALRRGDLAGDGLPELIATIPGEGRIAVVDPYQGEVYEYAAGSRPWSLAVGDVDGDARPDVVALDVTEGALQVLRGAGDGELLPATSSPSSRHAIWLELADHDGDGDLDVLARDGRTNVLVHRNDGAGQLSSPSALPFFGALPEGAGMAAGPVASSGLVGVSVPEESSKSLTTWFGKGAVWLGRVETYLGAAAMWVGEGAGGLVLAGGESYLARFAWQPALTPIAVWRSDVVKSSSHGAVVATGDLDGDHLLDVAVATDGWLHLLHGRADLGLEPGAKFPLHGSATALVIADVTGDGRSDIVINEDGRALAILGGDDGEHVFGESFELEVPALGLVALRAGANQPAAIATIPATGYKEATTPGASVMRFAGDGSVTIDVLADGLFVDAMVAVDFDEDGVDEPLILGRREAVTVLTHMTPDGAGFSPGVEHDLVALSGVTPEMGYTRHLTAGDVDGDGAPEVLALFAGTPLWITGLVDGAPVVTMASNAPTHLRDVDGDGLVDAVHLSSSTFQYRRGRGDGTFADSSPRSSFPRGHATAFAAVPGAQFDIIEVAYDSIATHLVREVVRPVEAGDEFNFHGDAGELVTGDLDGDGRDEVVTMSFDGGVAWMWGSETDPLARVDGSNGLGENRGLAIGDLDGDGAAEVLSADIINWIHAYQVHPRLDEPYISLDTLGLGPIMRLAVADVDGDRRADILALHAGVERIDLVVAHGGVEPFRHEPWLLVASLPVREYASLELGDVDDDGDLDIVIDPRSNPGALVRNLGARMWAEPAMLPGEVAMFSRPDADGQVELVSQDGTTIYRHDDGEPEQRTPLVTEEAGVLIRAADANGDGRYELVVAEPEATFLWLRGDDGFVRVQLAEVPFELVDFPDIDGDARPDLVALSGGAMFVRRARL